MSIKIRIGSNKILFNDFYEIKDMIGDMGCIYESLKEIKVLMIKKFDENGFWFSSRMKGWK